MSTITEYEIEASAAADATKQGFLAAGEALRARLPFPTVVKHAYMGWSQTATNDGGDHIVVAEAIASGRLKRKAGDALCKPSHKFWGLQPGHADKANCLRCLEIAERLALPAPEASGAQC
jgi:hypothetical protein